MLKMELKECRDVPKLKKACGKGNVTSRMYRIHARSKKVICIICLVSRTYSTLTLKLYLS